MLLSRGRPAPEGVSGVYVRTTTIEGVPDRIDAIIAFAREKVQPLLDTLDGSLGLAMFVDRQRGRAKVTTAWQSQQARAASDAALAPLRAEAGELFGGAPTVEELDVALVDRQRPAQPGYWVRMTRVQGSPEQIDAAVAAYRTHAAPVLKTVPGFCATVLLVDRTTGAALASTTWDSAAALTASRAQGEQVRAATAAAMGAQVLAVEEYEIAIADIRPPSEHEAAFRRAYRAMSAGGDLDDLDAVIATDIVDHAPVPPGTPPGLPGVKTLVASYREAFPDLQVTLETYLEQGDLACAAFRIRGTNTGPFMGAPPTGRSVEVTGVDIARFADGKCVEHWGGSDDLGLLTQLGMFTIPQQGTTIELPDEARV